MSGGPERRRKKRSSQNQSSDHHQQPLSHSRSLFDSKDVNWVTWLSSIVTPEASNNINDRRGPTSPPHQSQTTSNDEDEKKHKHIPQGEELRDRRKAKRTSDIENTKIFSAIREDSLDESVRTTVNPRVNASAEASIVKRCFYPRIRSYAKEAISLPQCNYKSISFHKHQHVFDVDPQRQTTHKRIMRSRADPWRRYGAQQAIHRLGGHVITSNQKKNRKTKYVIPGTPMPPPPNLKPITTLKELYGRPLISTTRKSSTPDEKGTDNTDAPDLDDPGDCCASPLIKSGREQ